MAMMNRKHLRTARPVAKLRQGRNDWYRIENKSDGGVEVFIYDEIGYWGVTAADFVKDLQNVTADKFTLRLNSPGGEVFDGIAIYNAIKQHKAEVTVQIDGLAASAASFIAMAGDTVTMTKNATMMIHDGHGLVVGDATDMRKMADLLDKTSNNIASIYAERTGGDVATWRAAMLEETWYNADEAVEAKLADGILDASGDEPENDWDLTIFARHADRPVPDTVPVPVNKAEETPVKEEEDDVEFAIDPEMFRSALEDPFEFDAATFRSIIEDLTTNAPATPTVAPLSDPPERSVTMAELAKALREGLLQ
jgi:ATP-dependent protease ClpP protease subunit